MPYDVAVGPDGYVYVADSSNHRVQKFDDSGNFVAVWGGPGFGYQNGQFTRPFDLEVSADNHVFVVEYVNGRVQKFTNDGQYVTQWGLFDSGDSKLFDPTALDISPGGIVYVASTGHDAIKTFDLDGTLIDEFGSTGTGLFSSISGVAIAGDGRLLTCSPTLDRIQIFSPAGSLIDTWQSRGEENGYF